MNYNIRTHTMNNAVMIHDCYGGRQQHAIQVTVKESMIMMITRYKSHKLTDGSKRIQYLAGCS